MDDDAFAERFADARCRVRSFSSAPSRSVASDGPVISDRLCGSAIADLPGERDGVDL